MNLDDLRPSIVDLPLKWERRVLRLKTTRIVKSDRRTQDILRQWAARWCRRNGGVLQPDIEYHDLSGRPEYYASGLLVLGVAWRYIHDPDDVLNGRTVVVQPGVHVLRIAIPARITTASVVE